LEGSDPDIDVIEVLLERQREPRAVSQNYLRLYGDSNPESFTCVYVYGALLVLQSTKYIHHTKDVTEIIGNFMFLCDYSSAPACALSLTYWNFQWALLSLPQARNSKASTCLVVGLNLLMAPLPFQACGLFLFSIFIFGTGSRFQPMTTVHPQTSPFSLNILLFHATCTPSVFKFPFLHTHHESLSLQKPSLLFLQAAL